MLSMFAMYLLVKCTAIQSLFSILCLFAFLIFTIAFIVKWCSIGEYYGNDKEKYEKTVGFRCNKFTWPFFSAGCFFLLLYFAMPNTKEMAIIYVTPKIVNSVMANEQLQKLPNNLLSLANAWIEEFKPDTNSVKKDGTKAEKKVEKKSEGKSIPDSTKEKLMDKAINKVVKEITKQEVYNAEISNYSAD